MLRQLGRVAESVAPLKRAFAANAKSAEIADLLGASLLDTGDGRGAVAVFEAAVKARPRDARGWLHLAVASQMAGNAKRALEAADASLAIAPDDAKALGARGQALAGARRRRRRARRRSRTARAARPTTRWRSTTSASSCASRATTTRPSSTCARPCSSTPR